MPRRSLRRTRTRAISSRDRHAAPAQPTNEATHDHAKTDDAQDLPPFIPRLTDEDRKAAFPDVEGHAVHDNAVNYFVLFDQLEWQAGDRDERLQSRQPGLDRPRSRSAVVSRRRRRRGRRVGEAQAHVLYGRQFSRWWDVVGGIRQDFRPGPAQTWAAIGVQGLAPYWFEVEATAYVGASGRTHARFEVEYELLLTNRLILQPLVEAEIFGKSDPERQIGAGLSTTDVGFRLRYEWRREFAPYVGLTWSESGDRPPTSPRPPAKTMAALGSSPACGCGSDVLHQGEHNDETIGVGAGGSPGADGGFGSRLMAQKVTTR